MSAAKLFISYSHKDAAWLEKLHVQMAILRAQNQVLAWSDRDIEAGERWEREINVALDESDVAVLLVSADFLASPFIMGKELPRMLENQSSGKLRRILPLIVAPCAWDQVPALKSLEVRPKGRELSSGSPHQIEADLRDFVREISEFLLKSAHQGSPAVTPTTTSALVLDRKYATLEIRVSHCEWTTYGVELHFTWSGDKKFDFSHRYRAQFDPGALIDRGSGQAYAQALGDALFPDEAALERIRLAQKQADELGGVLRVRFCIDPSARELHAFQWERLIADGGRNGPLALSTTAFARYALGARAGGTPVQIRRDATPRRALLLGVTAEMPGAEDMPALDALDGVQERLNALGIDCVTDKRWHSLPDLAEQVRKEEGVDYVYLVVHRSPDHAVNATLQLTGAGTYMASDRVREGICAALCALERPPRLTVIIPPGALNALAAHLPWAWYQQLAIDMVEQGILGALTLQSALDEKDWLAFLSTFLRELARDGQLDHAARAARSDITSPAARWAPVITARIRSARLWYVPHFMESSRENATWDLLLARIADGRCTPIVGPGVDHRIGRFRQELAMRWADRYQYPLSMHEYVNLPQVAQYVSATWGIAQMDQTYRDDLRSYALKRYGHLLQPEEARLALGQMLSVITARALEHEPADPHVILAELPFSTYVTANFNNFLADALKRARRDAQELVFSPNPTTADNRSASSAHPLVYQLFGSLDDDAPLVLTEDDYFDFLIDFSRERERIPGAVRSALSNSSLLFLGFNLNHWDFRVLFRSLLKDQSSQRRRKQLHVAVQVDPDDDQITDPDRAREYLESYFEGFAESDVSIYWGTCEDFLSELQGRWRRRRT